MKTIDEIKKTHVVPEEVKERRKECVRVNKMILKALESSEKTIPQIAEETGLPAHIVVFHLMTLRKYGDVKAGEIDDMDEYYFYSR